jgi:23S rRNA G2445 N2-methylase RlmL
MIEQHTLEKKIKRHLYGQPQSILVLFPAGLSSVARDEAQSILDNLWFQNKFDSKITVLKNALRIDQIHLFAVMELMMRGLCFTDIRLIISEGKSAHMTAFEKTCAQMSWDFYLTSAMSIKIKVDVGASPALHEGAIKEVIAHCISNKIKNIVSGEDAEETTLLYIDVYKYHAITSISLAGAPLYKRGYRSVLSHSAPLREDIAGGCIQKALQFAKANDADLSVDSLLVPFSGTGTFLFEYWLIHYQIAPALFDRIYAVQSMPLFRQDHFHFLLKKAREYCSIEQLASSHFCCIDNAESANAALLKNIENVEQAIKKNLLPWHLDANQCFIQDDFLKMKVEEIVEKVPGDVFIPLNPPYGIRFGNGSDTVQRYKRIAEKLNEIRSLKQKQHHNIFGFILCPTEAAWSIFCKTLASAKIETSHFTQGGLDIRVAVFYL